MQNFKEKKNACLRSCCWCKGLEDMKQLIDRSHLHTGNIPTPKLIIKPDLF